MSLIEGFYQTKSCEINCLINYNQNSKIKQDAYANI